MNDSKVLFSLALCLALAVALEAMLGVLWKSEIMAIFTFGFAEHLCHEHASSTWCKQGAVTPKAVAKPDPAWTIIVRDILVDYAETRSWNSVNDWIAAVGDTELRTSLGEDGDMSFVIDFETVGVHVTRDDTP